MIPDDSPPSRGLRRAPTRSHATLSEDPFGPSFLTVCDPGKTPRPSRSSPAAEREPGSISCHEFLRGEKRPHHLSPSSHPSCPSGTRAHCRRGAARRPSTRAADSSGARRSNTRVGRPSSFGPPRCGPHIGGAWCKPAKLIQRRRRSGSKPGGLNTAVEHAACRL